MINLKEHLANIILENKDLGHVNDKNLVFAIIKKIMRSHNFSTRQAFNIINQIFIELGLSFPYDDYNQFLLEFNSNQQRTNTSSFINPYNSFFNGLGFSSIFDQFDNFFPVMPNNTNNINNGFVRISTYSNINGVENEHYESRNFSHLDEFYNHMFSLDNNGFYERSIFDIYSNIFNNLFDASQMNNVPLTATDDALKNIPIIEYSKLKDDEKDKYKTCIICFDDFDNDSKLRILPCLHGFHIDCIDKWLKEYNYKCPVCRSDKIDYEAKF